MNIMNNVVVMSVRGILCFRIPPISTEKRIMSDRRDLNLESCMGLSASDQPTRITLSAKSSRTAAVVSGSSRVHSSPTLRKGQRKDASSRNRQDLARCRDGLRGQISESEKPQTNNITNTLPSDIKLSSEVIVSNSLKFIVCLVTSGTETVQVTPLWRTLASSP